MGGNFFSIICFRTYIMIPEELNRLTFDLFQKAY